MLTEADLAPDVFLQVSVGTVGTVETVGPVGFVRVQSHLMMMINDDNGSVAPLRLKDLDLLVAIGGATCLVDGLLEEAVLASSAVLPDPLPWSVPPHFSGGNLI